MPRPVSWLPRLHEITRAVTGSARSHYDRRDLEKLFELQPRAAQKMLEMLPTVQVGTSRLVDREVLANFLEGVRDADNTETYLEQTRLAKAVVSHRRTGLSCAATRNLWGSIPCPRISSLPGQDGGNVLNG
jgi:hypothetical protein